MKETQIGCRGNSEFEIHHLWQPQDFGKKLQPKIWPDQIIITSRG